MPCTCPAPDRRFPPTRPQFDGSRHPRHDVTLSSRTSPHAPIPTGIDRSTPATPRRTAAPTAVRRAASPPRPARMPACAAPSATPPSDAARTDNAMAGGPGRDAGSRPCTHPSTTGRACACSRSPRPGADPSVRRHHEPALHGCRSYAVDLPGHGNRADHPAAYYRQPQDPAALAAAPSPMHGVTLQDNVRHVVDVLNRLAPAGPVILAGNSFGGLTVTAVANAVPDLLDRVACLSAVCLSDPAMVTDVRDVVDDNLLDAAAARIAVPLTGAPGVVRLNWRAAHADPGLFAQLKAAVMADATDHQFRVLLDSMDPDENYGVLEQGAVARADRWGRVPHTFVRLSSDRSIPPAVQDHMIRTADALTPWNPFDVHTLAASHVGYFSDPRPFAELLADVGAGRRPETSPA
ncbi:alpha/beta fold hydrolase [Streptomyces sp. NPDC087440]|uniref:alpha/beta fold hydrolase n=1 Tax=Streptomyces sp. NPDC087440 TaxID=3365790 RepID=UPI00382B73B2